MTLVATSEVAGSRSPPLHNSSIVSFNFRVNLGPIWDGTCAGNFSVLFTRMRALGARSLTLLFSGVAGMTCFLTRPGKLSTRLCNQSASCAGKDAFSRLSRASCFIWISDSSGNTPDSPSGSNCTVAKSPFNGRGFRGMSVSCPPLIARIDPSSRNRTSPKTFCWSGRPRIRSNSRLGTSITTARMRRVSPAQSSCKETHTSVVDCCPPAICSVQVDPRSVRSPNR